MESETVTVQLVVDPACNDKGIQDTVVAVDAADAGRVPNRGRTRNNNASGIRNRYLLSCLAIGLNLSLLRLLRIFRTEV